MIKALSLVTIRGFFLVLGLTACGQSAQPKENVTPSDAVHPNAENVILRSSSAIACPKSAQALHCDMSHIVFDRINELRKNENIEFLIWDFALADQAYKRACELGEIGVLSHEGWQQRILAAGYTPGGENIVMVNRPESEATAERMFILWKESAPHRANMISPVFNRIGVGVCRGSKGLFGVQLFSPDL